MIVQYWPHKRQTAKELLHLTEEKQGVPVNKMSLFNSSSCYFYISTMFFCDGFGKEATLPYLKPKTSKKSVVICVLC
jgi:hypothetical protein